MSDVADAGPGGIGGAGGDAAAAAAAAAAGGEGKGAATWRDTLPEGLRGDPSIAKYTSVEELVKGHKNLSNLVGREKIPVPKEEADWERWYTAAGRPETAAGYELKKPDGLPEGFAYDDGLAGNFAETAHKAGLNKAQVALLHQWWVDTAKGAFTTQAQAAEVARGNGEAALRQEWGAGYERNLTAAREVAQMFGGREFAGYLEETGLGNDPRMARFLTGIAKKVGGIETIPGDRRTTSEMTPGEIQEEINDLMRTKADVLADKSSPARQAVIDRLAFLYQRKNAGS